MRRTGFQDKVVEEFVPTLLVRSVCFVVWSASRQGATTQQEEEGRGVREELGEEGEGRREKVGVSIYV